MPISLDPEETRLFWLATDKDKPLDSRPVFVCNAPTRKTILRWSALRDEAVAIGSGPDAYAKLHAMIALGVKDWRNFGRTFSATELDDVLSNDELQELAFGWPECHKMTAEDRKGFFSPPPSDAAPSAPTAPASA